jgi:hypothetical protein
MVTARRTVWSMPTTMRHACTGEPADELSAAFVTYATLMPR